MDLWFEDNVNLCEVIAISRSMSFWRLLHFLLILTSAMMAVIRLLIIGTERWNILGQALVYC